MHLFLVACGNRGLVPITATDLPIYGTAPLNHTIYVGSDSAFHHFRWSHGKSSGSFIVPREQIYFGEAFSVGERSAFLTRDDDGTVRLLLLSGASTDQSVSPDL